MPLIYQKLIKRADLQRNSEVLYVFGDNLQRFGMGGQAGEMRNEPNAVGIATKKRPGRHWSDCFTDDEFKLNIETLVQDVQPIINHLRAGGIVVWPSDGIGTGLSDLPNRAPKTWAYFEYYRGWLETL